MRVVVIACAILATSCGPSPQSEPPAAIGPSLAEMSPREALLDCAGAVTAEAGVDPLAAEPTLGSTAENTYFVVLALLDKEPGLAGEAGREAAAVSRDAWLARSAEERAARAAECATRFGG